MTAFAHMNTTFEADGAMNLDARVLFYYSAGGVTPAMVTPYVGEGSDYGLAFLDGKDKSSDVQRPTSCICRPMYP